MTKTVIRYLDRLTIERRIYFLGVLIHTRVVSISIQDAHQAGCLMNYV